MNISAAAMKRARSGNFNREEIDLLLGLVEEHKVLVDSAKQDDKKKGWNLIHDTFNESFPDKQRDVPMLKMKLKNIKATKRRCKNDDSEATDEYQNSDQDTYDESSMQQQRSSRKRGKLFSNEEKVLLEDLIEQHIETLDTSLTRENLDLKNRAWEIVTDEFNKAQPSDFHRSLGELKIKYKNLKAQRLNEAIRMESEHLKEENTVVHIMPESSADRKPLRGTILNQSMSARSSSQNKAYEVIVENVDSEFEYVEEEYVSKSTEDDKELERIRKENILLKNSVLKKKERLLELQISIAERTLRRDIIS